MRPSDLIEHLDSVLPEIKRTGDPEGALLKFATRENLAPALLEKMAQLYNTAKNLTFLKKASNRGGSFSIIDTEALLARYTKVKDTKKSAAWTPELTKSAAEDSWFDVPTPEEFNSSRFPDIELRELSAAIKQAASALPKEPEPTEREKFAAQLVEARNQQTLEQIQDDYRDKSYQAFNKFANWLQTSGAPLQEVVDDMTGLIPGVSATFEALAVANPRLKTASVNPRNFYYDRHGARGLVNEMHEAVGIFKAAIAAPSTQTSPPQNKGGKGGKGGRSRQLTRDDIMAAVNDALAANPSSRPTGFGSPDLSANPSSRPKYNDSDDKSEKSEKSEKSKEEVSPFVNEFSQGLDGYLQSARQINPIKGVHGMIKDIGDLKGRNSDQELLDIAADDTKYVTTMQRLVTTDPILSEADPEQVVQLANSIRNANPAAAEDINFMRLALREALQYGALPQHTYKDLLDMRKTLAQSKQTETSNRGAEYGGSEGRV